MGYGTGAVVWIWMSNFHKGYSRLFNGGRLYTRSVFQPCFRFPSRTTIHGEAMSAAANYAWVNRSSMTFLTRQAFAKARGFILRVLSGAMGPGSNRHHIVITWVKPGTGLQSIARRFGYARDLCILTAVKLMCFSQPWQIADGWAFWLVEIAVVWSQLNQACRRWLLLIGLETMCF